MIRFTSTRISASYHPDLTLSLSLTLVSVGFTGLRRLFGQPDRHVLNHLGVASPDSNVVEEAEAHGLVRPRMMPGRSHAAESVHGSSQHDLASTETRCKRSDARTMIRYTTARGRRTGHRLGLRQAIRHMCARGPTTRRVCALLARRGATRFHAELYWPVPRRISEQQGVHLWLASRGRFVSVTMAFLCVLDHGPPMTTGRNRAKIAYTPGSMKERMSRPERESNRALTQIQCARETGHTVNVQDDHFSRGNKGTPCIEIATSTTRSIASSVYAALR